jgi:hypothetical protein
MERYWPRHYVPEMMRDGVKRMLAGSTVIGTAIPIQIGCYLPSQKQNTICSNYNV